MEIKVLGTGCKKCRATRKLIEEVAREKGSDVDVMEVKDLMEITEYNIMSTPGVVVGGKVVSSGKVPSRKDVEAWIEVE
jgi:small redox-active disulfide protein 2